MEPTQVVRIFATVQDPDYEVPWQSAHPSTTTGSGVVIGPDRVLTGAHVVANATFLQVQTVTDPDKVVATVEAICHDCDLALLRVADPDALADVEPAEIGALPRRRDPISVVGFPVGGEELSITEGVVSRIEVQRYAHSQRELLAVTVDAAINDGNSGGPVFGDGRVVGIAFQSLEDAENVGEAVPAPLIRRFLDGVEAGRPLDVPGFGFTTQTLENPTLRRTLGMPPGESGVLLVSVEHGGSSWGVLEPGDVLLEVEGTPIANNATVRHHGDLRTRMDVLLGRHFVGDPLPVVVRRGGERLEATLTLRPFEVLVPRNRYGVAPRYFAFGGLVVVPLTRDFLRTWSKWTKNAPKELLHHYYHGHRTAERREVVVVAQILADDLTVGYECPPWESVRSVNGTVPRDLRHFVELVEARTDFLCVETASGRRLVLDVEQARAAQRRILARYHIPSDRSADLPGGAGA